MAKYHNFQKFVAKKHCFGTKWESTTCEQLPDKSRQSRQIQIDVQKLLLFTSMRKKRSNRFPRSERFPDRRKQTTTHQY